MPWIAVALVGGWGLAYLLFAFVEPPAPIRSWFKVPAIMVFLPERFVVPAGRLFLGVLCLAGAVIFALRMMAAGALPGQ